MKYETLGGQVTRGETFAKMMGHLREPVLGTFYRRCGAGALKKWLSEPLPSNVLYDRR